VHIAPLCPPLSKGNGGNVILLLIGALKNKIAVSARLCQDDNMEEFTAVDCRNNSFNKKAEPTHKKGKPL
jgi:hypothetical protein